MKKKLFYFVMGLSFSIFGMEKESENHLYLNANDLQAAIDNSDVFQRIKKYFEEGAIIVVDDTPFTHIVFEKIIKTKVVSFMSGGDFLAAMEIPSILELIKKAKAIILDKEMPKVDGFQVVAEIINKNRFPIQHEHMEGIPLILNTSSRHEELDPQQLTNFTLVLPKKNDFRDLKNKIESRKIIE